MQRRCAAKKLKSQNPKLKASLTTNNFQSGGIVRPFFKVIFMATNLNKLLQKRVQLEQQILVAQQIEKRKARVQQIVLAALDKHERITLATDEILREKLETIFSEITQNFPNP